MASPHVAGAAALYLAANPCATPSLVASVLTGQATIGVISNAGAGTPNRLLNVSGISAAPTATPGIGRVDLSWGSSYDAGTPVTGYDIFRSSGGQDPGGPLPGMPLAAGATSYSDTSVVDGTPHTYTVRARHGANDGPACTTLTATAQAPSGQSAPGAVTLTAQSGDTKVHLAWPVASGTVDQYRIYRGGASGTEGTVPIAVVTGLSFDDVTVTNGSTYWYQVAASNAGLEAPRSTQAQATRRARQPCRR